MVYLALYIYIAWWIFPWRTASHNQIRYMFDHVCEEWIDLPSGKRLHNYGKIHHFLAGKIHYFYGKSPFSIAFSMFTRPGTVWCVTFSYSFPRTWDDDPHDSICTRWFIMVFYREGILKWPQVSGQWIIILVGGLVGGDWNHGILWLSIYWECHHPNWRTHSF